jgi:hypothetical protein
MVETRENSGENSRSKRTTRQTLTKYRSRSTEPVANYLLGFLYLCSTIRVIFSSYRAGGDGNEGPRGGGSQKHGTSSTTT